MTPSESPASAEPAAWIAVAHTFTGYLLMKLGELAAGGAARLLEPIQLRPRQVYVLATLAAVEAPSQQDVSRRLGIDPNVMVGVMDELEGRGLVQRRRNPRDRRRHLVTLTDAGHQVLSEAMTLLGQAERALQDAMTPEELAVVRAVAQRLLSEHGDLIER